MAHSAGMLVTGPHARSSLRFGPLVIEYDARVLRPREWTAVQSRWAAQLLVDRPEGPILELCTGAGHIGLLAAQESGRELVAVDLDPVACAFARHNAQEAGLTEGVEVRESTLEEAVGDEESFAVVIADPPWVTSSEVDRYPEDPLSAIDGGADGLDLARRCLAVGAAHLQPGGSLLLQLGSHAQCDRMLSGVEELHGLEDGGRRSGSGGVILRLVLPD